MQSDLSSFGASTTPRIRKQSSVTLGPRTVGYIAHDEANGAQCYASERNSEEHRYYGDDPWYDLTFDGPAFGLSMELFGRLHGNDVGRVYIIEPDTEMVYHYAFQQFVDGEHINDRREAEGRGYEKDHQKVVPIAEAVDSWQVHPANIYARQPAYNM